jgi:hypothetical protein
MGIASAFLLPPSLSELRRTRSLVELRPTSRSTHPTRSRQAAIIGVSKAEFNGTGGLRVYILIEPTCGTLSPCKFRPQLVPLAGAVSFLGSGEVSSGSAFGAKRTYAGTPMSAKCCQQRKLSSLCIDSVSAWPRAADCQYPHGVCVNDEQKLAHEFVVSKRRRSHRKQCRKNPDRPQHEDAYRPLPAVRSNASNRK